MNSDDRCRFCGKPIRYDPYQRRRQYCNNVCRQAAYRLRTKFGADQIPTERVREEWKRRGYFEPLIEHLAMLCGDNTTGEFLYRLETVLLLHKSWLEEEATKRNEP
jgi:hypothetical protein